MTSDACNHKFDEAVQPRARIRRSAYGYRRRDCRLDDWRRSGRPAVKAGSHPATYQAWPAVRADGGRRRSVTLRELCAYLGHLTPGARCSLTSRPALSRLLGVALVSTIRARVGIRPQLTVRWTRREGRLGDGGRCRVHERGRTGRAPPIHADTRMRLKACCLAALILLAGCTSTSQPQAQTIQQPTDKPACQAAGSARGIATGFFDLFQDRPECF